MSKASKRRWREVGLVRRYAAEVAKEWRAILGSLVVIALLWLLGYYGAATLSRIIIPLMPPAVAPWLTRNSLIVISALAILALAQYLSWRAATLEWYKLKKEKTLSIIEADLDLKFGQRSNLAPARRFKLASARFEQLEKEVYSGDFSNAAEVAVFRIIFVPILQGWFGGGVGYPAWHARLVKLVDTVSQHEREQAEAWQ